MRTAYYELVPWIFPFGRTICTERNGFFEFARLALEESPPRQCLQNLNRTLARPPSVPYGMELELFKSISSQLASGQLSRADLELHLQTLRDYRLVAFICADAENDLSETRSKSAELRTKWLRRVVELLGQKKDAETRLAGLSLFRETTSAVTYEVVLAHYESWFSQLLGIFSHKVRPRSAGVVDATPCVIVFQTLTFGFYGTDILLIIRVLRQTRSPHRRC